LPSVTVATVIVIENGSIIRLNAVFFQSHSITVILVRALLATSHPLLNDARYPEVLPGQANGVSGLNSTIAATNLKMTRKLIPGLPVGKRTT